MTTPQLRLRSDVQFTPVRSGEKLHYIVEDGQSKRFLRIGSLEYELCGLFDGERSAQSVMEVFQRRSAQAGDVSPERCQKVVGWVLGSGLLEVGNPRDIEPSSTATATSAPVRAPASKVFDPSFFRIPCMSPNTMERIASTLSWLVSWPVLVGAIAIWCIAAIMLAHHGNEFADIGRKLFVPGHQWWFLVAWFLLKGVHETGHAVACARIGCKPSGAGIGFMFFAPSPYVDVTQVWSVGNRWHRILVSSAGMLFEITFSAMALILASMTQNASIQYLCVSIAGLGTLTTLAFNGNPLMRFDGYYIVIDAINRPNLWQDGSKSVSNFVQRGLLTSVVDAPVSLPLLLYGLACLGSRTLMMLTMAWGVWVAWDGIGLLIIGFFLGLWFVVPAIVRHYRNQENQTRLATKPSHWTKSLSPRKLARCSGLLLVGLFIGFLPSPVQVYWPGFVDYTQPSEVRAGAPGFVVDVLVHDCQGVNAGDEILRMHNPDLELELCKCERDLAISGEKCDALRAQRKLAELQAEESMLESLRVKVESLRSKVAGLSIRASRSGVLLARKSQSLRGSFLTEGQAIGLIADPSDIEVRASLPQGAWEQIAHRSGANVELCFQNGDRFGGEILQTLPRTEESIETPALAGKYGGPLTVVTEKKPNGEEWMKTHEPRLSTRIRFKAPRPKWIAFRRNDSLPIPGSLCTVQLEDYQETIWSSIIRFVNAALDRKLRSISNVD